MSWHVLSKLGGSLQSIEVEIQSFSTILAWVMVISFGGFPVP